MRYLVLLLALLSTLIFTLPASAQTKPELQQQLLNMAQQSQQIQTTLKNDSPKVLKSMAIDIVKLHTQTLNEIVQFQGWPTKDHVGKEGVIAAFQLVQHSLNLAFQQDMLPLIIQSFIDKDGIAGQDVAEFTDNVSIKLGKKQVFGTQAGLINGKVEFLPIENEDSVDQLRAQMGMQSLAEYKKSLEILNDIK